MKILQLIQKRQLRGAEIFASQLAEGLKKQGHEVMIVTLFEGNSTLPFSGTIKSLNAPGGNRLLEFRVWKKLSSIIREFHPDIVQANAGDTLKYAVISKLLFRWPGKLVFRNANLMSAFLRGSFHYRFNVWLLSCCNFYISVSENCRQDLIRLYPKAVQRSVTVPIGIDDVDGIAPAKRDVSNEQPLFIAVGSLVPEKNHTFVIDVFDRFFRTECKGYLWLVGDGRLREELERKVSKLKLEERVKFLGYRDDVVPLLKASDVFIMPSLIEGLPAVILEAMACEVPVITSGAGGIPEVVETDVTGICLRKLSTDDYVDAINRLLAESKYKDQLVRHAREMVLKKYSLNNIVAEFALHYKKMIGQQ